MERSGSDNFKNLKLTSTKHADQMDTSKGPQKREVQVRLMPRPSSDTNERCDALNNVENVFRVFRRGGSPAFQRLIRF
jgi:hypothetical protein